MARRCGSAPALLVCIFATIVAGLGRADAATAKSEESTSGGAAWAYATAIATTAREKILACRGASAEDGVMPLVLLGAAAAILAFFTLYLLSVFLDKEPFLFNGGRVGKLEAQSRHTAGKNKYS